MWSGLRRSSSGPRPSERLRIPQPLIRTRLPCGRGATEQPNVTSDGDTALSPLFWMVLVAPGSVRGLFGALMTWTLYRLAPRALGSTSGPLEPGVRYAPDLR